MAQGFRPGERPMRDDDPWLIVATGSDLSDLRRGAALTPDVLWRAHGLVRDEELQRRYHAAGIVHVFYVVSVADPGRPLRRPYFRRRDDELYVEADLVDDPSIPPGEEFDIWFEPQVRQVLENYKGLKER